MVPFAIFHQKHFSWGHDGGLGPQVSFPDGFLSYLSFSLN